MSSIAKPARPTTALSLDHQPRRSLISPVRPHAKVERNTAKAKEAQARALHVRREQVHQAALDNIAGEAVSALFATMAARAAGAEIDDTTRDDPSNGGGSRVGIEESRGGWQRRPSGNQGGEEETGPRREGVNDGNRQGPRRGNVKQSEACKGEGELHGHDDTRESHVAHGAPRVTGTSRDPVEVSVQGTTAK